jgi:hypothetical protein
MKNLYHDDFGTHDLVQELRIAKERRFFRLEQGTPEKRKEMATGWKKEAVLDSLDVMCRKLVKSIYR